MFVERPSRGEKLLRYALAALGLTLILALLLAVRETQRIAVPSVPESMRAPEVGNEGEEESPTEELTGTVVAVDIGNSYIRILNDKDGKIYSIALPPSDMIQENTPKKDISALAPSDKISFLVTRLPDTERTDFSAVSFEVVGQKELPRIEAETDAE